MKIPTIRLGGMGVYVSGWKLAKTVAKLGQIGTISSTGIHEVVCRVLQNGDPEGHYRRALSAFPFPEIAEKIIKTYYQPNGQPANTPYHTPRKPSVTPDRDWVDILIASNFAEVWLAKEGHSGIIGINCMEKLQIPIIFTMFGAMLAGANFVAVGAGIPNQVSAVLDGLSCGQEVSYKVHTVGMESGHYTMTFDPKEWAAGHGPVPEPKRPDFLPIISTPTLAEMLLRKAPDGIQGFILEHHTAGGHNAPPRGALKIENGEPVYGERDEPDLKRMRELEIPFWMAGSRCSPEAYQEALAEGAAGIQVGSAFGFCLESGYDPLERRELLRRAFSNRLRVHTDPIASPTGFPFKIPYLPGTLAEHRVYTHRPRRCGSGLLRETFVRPDGEISYRCPAEPLIAYRAKGGTPEDAEGRVCLCEALLSAVGLGQVYPTGYQEPPIMTSGEDFSFVRRIMGRTFREYTAADVINFLLGPSAAETATA